jgi:ankyrin repeat protein
MPELTFILRTAEEVKIRRLSLREGLTTPYRAPIDTAWAEIIAGGKNAKTLEGFKTLFNDRDRFELRHQQKVQRALLDSSLSSTDRLKVLEEATLDQVNATDEEGKTALCWAVLRGDAEFVEALLDAGADPNISDNNNDTPLALCTHGTTPELMTLLIKRGAKFTANLRGYTPLHKAAFRQNSIEYMKPLFSAGFDFDINGEADGSDAPLCMAAWNDNDVAAAFLLDNGARIDQPDETGVTPLFDSLKFGCYKVLELLLQRGADMSFQSTKGRTLLHHLADFGKIEAVEVFQTYVTGLRTVDVEARNEDGLTAAQIAMRRQHTSAEFKTQFMSLLATVKYLDMDVGSEKSWDSAHDIFEDCVDVMA